MSHISVVKPTIAVALERLGIRMSFAKGSEIFSQGEELQRLYCVAKGAVRTTRVLSDGRRQVGDFYCEGDLIGVETGFVHRFSAEALGDCSILVVRRSAFQAACRDGSMSDILLEATQRELERTQAHLLALERKSACERVASFLLAFAPGDEDKSLMLPMGRRDMADYLDLTIETVSRMVTYLQVLRLVKFSGTRRYQVLQREALELLAA